MHNANFLELMQNLPYIRASYLMQANLKLLILKKLLKLLDNGYHIAIQLAIDIK